MPVRGQLRVTYDVRVGIYGVLVEADAGKETLESCVAVSEVEFAIESAASFVNDIVPDGAQIRERNRVIANVSLCETESRHWREHRRSSSSKSLRIVDTVDVIFVAKVVVYAKSSQISG